MPFVCGGIFLETVAPHVPALLGLDRPPGPTTRGHDASSRIEAGPHTRSELAELERRVDELEAERDFYKALAEPRIDGAEVGIERGSS